MARATASAGPSSTPTPIRPSADIALRPEQIIQGRLFDVKGQPVAGAIVCGPADDAPPVRRCGRPRAGSSRPLKAHIAGGAGVNDAPAGPCPVESDADGRFAVRGVGRGEQATLDVHDPRFALAEDRGRRRRVPATEARQGEAPDRSPPSPAASTGRSRHRPAGRA